MIKEMEAISKRISRLELTKQNIKERVRELKKERGTTKRKNRKVKQK